MLRRGNILSLRSLNVRHYSAKVNIKIENSTTLKKPVYNFKGISENLDHYLLSAKRRELPQDVLKEIQNTGEYYAKVKDLTTSLTKIRAEKNISQVTLKELRQKKEIGAKYEEQLKIQGMLKKLEKEINENIKAEELKLYGVMESFPNALHESVKDEQELVKYLNPKDQYEPIPELEHSKIAQDFGIVDLKAGSTVSGSSWYYLIGDGALLEQALVQYALKLARKHGYKMVTPPSIVKVEVSDACGFKPRDQNGEVQTYELKQDGLVLTGTAEIPLAGLAINKTFNEQELPERVVGVSRSYRAEAGARGRDTKGLYRVHEFTKVELFVWAAENQSEGELEKLREFQEELITSLGLSARVLNMPANDLGAPAIKKYDIEAWMPGRGNWGELTSTSNCTDFQSRRTHTKYKNKELQKSFFVHTLNGTALAVPRVIVALIENFYDPSSNRIAIPKVLQSYMDDKEFIEKVN